MITEALDVPQRVDGTEKERQGILSVMERANEYYCAEVLSQLGYRLARKYWYVQLVACK